MIKNRFQKERRRIESLMGNVENVHTIENELETLNQIVDEFQRSYAEWSGLLEEDDEIAAKDWYIEHIRLNIFVYRVSK